MESKLWCITFYDRNENARFFLIKARGPTQALAYAQHFSFYPEDASGIHINDWGNSSVDEYYMNQMLNQYEYNEVLENKPRVQRVLH